jgi:hypothetical protein
MSACEEFPERSILFRPLLICLDAFKIYNKLLTTNPVLTKSVTSGILGAAGATVASLMINKVKGLERALFSHFVMWHTSAISLAPGDVILTKLACPPP